MACSEKQRVANQLNAQKSTGPVTEAGKQKTRRNALKHGFCSEVLALDTEVPELIEEERQLWLDDLAPSGHVAERMVERAFRAYLRLDRCDRARDARLAARQERATRDWELGIIAERDRGISMLMTLPTAAITLLRSLPEGCEWLADKWADLQHEFEAGVTDDDHYARMLDLLGKQGCEHWRIKSQILLYHAMLQDKKHMKSQGMPDGADEAYLRANLNGAYVDRVLATRVRGEAARADLIEFCRSRVQSFRARDQALAPQFLAEREQARAAALFDDSPEALRLHRYASDADRELHRNVKAARSARQNPPSDLPSTSPESKTAQEVTETISLSAEPLSSAPRNEPIFTATPSAKTPEWPSSDTRNEPISIPQTLTAHPSTTSNEPRNEAISTLQPPVRPSESTPETAQKNAPNDPHTASGSHSPTARPTDETLQNEPFLAITGPVSPPATATRNEPVSPPVTHNPRAIHPSTLARLRAERAERGLPYADKPDGAPRVERLPDTASTVSNA